MQKYVHILRLVGPAEADVEPVIGMISQCLPPDWQVRVGGKNSYVIYDECKDSAEIFVDKGNFDVELAPDMETEGRLVISITPKS
jgi:hypothetical protein